MTPERVFGTLSKFFLGMMLPLMLTKSLGLAAAFSAWVVASCLFMDWLMGD